MDKVNFITPTTVLEFELFSRSFLDGILSVQQTNTADMLDLAVDYIKELQNEVQVYISFDRKCDSTLENLL